MGGMTVDPPFGTHALPPWLERLRRFGGRLGRGAAARRATSAIRRLCQAGRPDPFDVEPFAGQRARLYPSDNLSEKRVFAAPQFWDWAERAALARAMAATDAPFHFVDAGANAGLYSLAVRSFGPARILAVEPAPAALSRLRTNLALSGAAEVTVAPVALSDRAGTAHIAAAGSNLGEAALGDAGTEVETLPLLDLLEAQGFGRVDALKIDIEGHEEPVLADFLARAPAALWPRLAILEARRGAETPALALMRAHGYVIVERTKMNAILGLAHAETGAAPAGTTQLQENTDGADGKA
ncbi:FkbM family methyltransferase [Paralimibaculum aggregatum]|uniref:FkbM family methyltransferase n=1 Tax=Paralimibaculum aggregatum TaxID=3036245 RepID=A0ABQ6LSB9_9RHOB|nr:FkbM family methyltransferase [Limibaculum sp. NKW23]GMG84910.1 FkbM family methyltransferase [Limibaculum sp. NKW23]